MKRLIFDLDDTLCSTEDSQYANAVPNIGMIHKLREYRNQGFEIIIHTSRNMRTFNNNIGKINANTIPIIITWLDKHSIPFDEIYIGKPWCGFEGFYIDDKSIRPKEFLNLSYDELIEITRKK
jgi:capsule biosynthesis phosphatase